MPLLVRSLTKCLGSLGGVLVALVLSGVAVGPLASPAWGQSAGGSSREKAITIRERDEAIASAVPRGERVPDRFGLVIGADSYADERIPDLPACRRDAGALASVLKDPLVGMFPREQVTVLTGSAVTREAITAALDALGRQAGPEDLVVVFFSGHGAVDDRGRSYWVMHDTDITQLRATAMPEAEITDLLSDIKTSRLVTLIDACYSAATAQISESKSLLKLDELFPEFEGRGRVVLTASAGDELSVVISEGEGAGYSAFAWHVINGLKGLADGAGESGDGDGVVTLTELWTYVKDRTERTARLQGRAQRPRLKGELGSRFLLTVDAERLVKRSREVQEWVGRLRELALDQQVTVGQHALGKRLLESPLERLDEEDRERREVFVALVKGELAPRFLEAALDAIESEEEREARLAREAAAAAEAAAAERAAAAEAARVARVADLVAAAQSAGARRDGAALARALEEAGRLDPGNAEVRRLLEQFRSLLGPSHGDRRTVDLGGGVTMEFVYIDAPSVAPNGFLRGSPAGEEGRDSDETQHRVRLTKGYWLQTTEVTIAQFRRFVEATGHRTDAEREDRAWGIKDGLYGEHIGLTWRSPGLDGYRQGANEPVTTVSWNDATAFARWLAGFGVAARLPTEAEWEFAARAGTTTAYPWGGSIAGGELYANVADLSVRSKYANWTVAPFNDRVVYTAPVGRYAANQWGLHDMIGNVWEWCSDRYGTYPAGTVEDPTGPRTGSSRVLRGGSWYDSPWYCRAAIRNHSSPGGRSSIIGFRLALDPRP